MRFPRSVLRKPKSFTGDAAQGSMPFRETMKLKVFPETSLPVENESSYFGQ